MIFYSCGCSLQDAPSCSVCETHTSSHIINCEANVKTRRTVINGNHYYHSNTVKLLRAIKPKQIVTGLESNMFTRHVFIDKSGFKRSAWETGFMDSLEKGIMFVMPFELHVVLYQLSLLYPLVTVAQVRDFTIRYIHTHNPICFAVGFNVDVGECTTMQQCLTKLDNTPTLVVDYPLTLVKAITGAETTYVTRRKYTFDSLKEKV